MEIDLTRTWKIISLFMSFVLGDIPPKEGTTARMVGLDHSGAFGLLIIFLTLAQNRFHGVEFQKLIGELWASVFFSF